MDLLAGINQTKDSGFTSVTAAVVRLRRRTPASGTRGYLPMKQNILKNYAKVRSQKTGFIATKTSDVS